MEIRLLNYRVGHLVADYLDASPCAVTPELLAELLPEGADAATEERVYAALLSGFFGLDGEASAEDRFIEEQYLRPGLRRMNPAVYRENPYYRNIRIEEHCIGQWELTHQSYQPCELFLRDDLILTDDLRQIPAIGYFPEAFSFPSVLQEGREWMSIKPSEIESSQAAVDAASGRVVTFGLGLGYFAYLAARKPEVAEVTVVERDPAVIALFEGQILPQFECRRKVRVVQADAFDFLDRDMEGLRPDFVFMDIWHDIGDGLDPYVRAKGYEARFPATRFRYWIERSLRCALIDVLEHRFE
jgi:hypothetical protein